MINIDEDGFEEMLKETMRSRAQIALNRIWAESIQRPVLTDEEINKEICLAKKEIKSKNIA
ncbi:hypothetical protein FACS189465_0380 [Clostridia bacterium]|nr:hypothetical protein FACS189465_0380 [Clostridia bacterium]